MMHKIVLFHFFLQAEEIFKPIFLNKQGKKFPKEPMWQ
jgi:hypothetical protein